MLVKTEASSHDESSQERMEIKRETTDDNSNSSIKKEGVSDSEEKSAAVSSFKFKKRFGKNPNVDTSFLPDKEREAEEDSLR